MRTVYLAVSLMFGVAAPAAAVTIDFETSDVGAPAPGVYGEGAPITNVVGDTDNGFFDDTFGVTFTSQNRDGAGNPIGGNAGLTLFDSSCPGGCSGQDPDLETGPAFNSPNAGLVLIAQENFGAGEIDGNGFYVDPDDQTQFDITANFNTTDNTLPIYENGVTIDQIILIDQDETNQPTFEGTDIFGTVFNITASNTLVNPLFPGDNSYRIFTFANAVNLREFEIIFQGSGAIDILVFTPSAVIPLPPAALLLAGGLGLLAWRARSARKA